jgi:hypothetical protein
MNEKLLRALICYAENDCQRLAEDHEAWPDVEKAKELREIKRDIRAARRELAQMLGICPRCQAKLDYNPWMTHFCGPNGEVRSICPA